jgi:hypothetical protein
MALIAIMADDVDFVTVGLTWLHADLTSGSTTRDCWWDASTTTPQRFGDARPVHST